MKVLSMPVTVGNGACVSFEFLEHLKSSDAPLGACFRVRSKFDLLRKKLNREVCSQAEACQDKSIFAKLGPPAPPKKCSKIVVEPFDDGWLEYEETFINVQA
jgi:hypothetical protein